MEIRVKCVCGSVFSFEEALENNRVKFPVSCLACGSDCTAKANEYITHKLAPPADPSQLSVWKRWLGLKPKRNEFEELDRTDLRSGDEAKEANPINGDETSTQRLVVAAGASLLVGLAGAFGWLWLTKTTGWEFGYAAWGLGALAGGASYLLAPRGHPMLGTTAALAAFISIGGGQYLVGRDMILQHVSRSLPLAYAQSMSYAKDVMAATSDDDLRPAVATYKLEVAVAGERAGTPIDNIQTFQADLIMRYIADGVHTIQAAENSQAGDIANVTESDIGQFKLKVLPQLEALEAGKPSAAEYKDSLAKKTRSEITTKTIVIESLNPYTALWIFLGIATAYRLARNKGLQY
jgi:hypothetical protein